MTGPDDRDDAGGPAAEYVLGLLGPEEAAAARARLERDAEFRAEVAFWTERFAALAEAEAEEAPPPATLYRSIEARLFEDGAAKRGVWRQLGLVPAVLGAAAAGLLLYAVTTLGLLAPADDAGVPAWQAELSAEGADLVIVAAIDPAAGQVALNRMEGGPRPGRALELWLVPEGRDPVSLGVLPEARLAVLDLPREVPGGLGAAALAVSDEPPGGSPAGAPTGEILAVAPVEPL